MAKYSVPGIRFTEIDNSIQTESTGSMGVGAIVMKSNKGPVNQRIVTKNYGEFTDIFGEPESLTDYGHFAAENYFSNSTQLFAVRCTMGDEQYAQIQYTYPDASTTATNTAANSRVYKYVDNQGDYQLKLIEPLENLTDVATQCLENWKAAIEADSEYVLYQEARYGDFANIMAESTDHVVYKAFNHDPDLNPDILKGVHVCYPKNCTIGGNYTYETQLIFTKEAWDSLSASPSMISPGVETTIDAKNQTDAGDSIMQAVTISVPEEHTLNNSAINITFQGKKNVIKNWLTTGIKYKDIFKSENFIYSPKNMTKDWLDNNLVEMGGLYGYTNAYKISIVDWEDPTTPKYYYIDSATLTGTAHDHDSKKYPDSCAIDDDYHNQKAVGIRFTEFIRADETYAIVGAQQLDGEGESEEYIVSAVSAMYQNTDTKIDYLDNRTPREVINDMMEELSIPDVSEINNCSYCRYYQVLPDERIVETIIREDKETVDHNKCKYLFALIAGLDDQTTTTVAAYSMDTLEKLYLPLMENHTYKDETKTVKLNNIVATPTSYLVNSVDKTYADGYTILTQSEDEPGNGDIENYESLFDNQLVIASIGPGEYGNNIGIGIITAECANVKALQHQNAFNWKYSFDDEDLVNADAKGLTWKKVFRINVYVKNANQTATGAWGNGMNALLRDPAESWLVSTDPTAKDAEGNSLYAPTVVNGHSDYIYISRSSITKALNCHGEYEQPLQTYSVYQLTGGKNSTKDNIAEKTAALNFYSDRQKAKFDILFNVDAIDSFNGRQRYNAHQRKIAEIAARRTMDIGVVQVTSKSAKTCKMMLSESKMFSFNNGSYVAEYAGYDKYYNSTLAAWIYLPKSVAGACAMAYCDTFAYPWMAPAGVARGTISYTTGQLLRLTDDEIGQLYDNNVNSTRDCGGYGTVLWGQKTALKKNSLLNRINIRRCLNYIEKQLENMMTPYLFMQNSINTRSSARNDIDSFLQRVQAAEGLDSFSLSVTQDPEDPTIMNVNISLVPTSAIEFIDVKVIINRNRGVTVEEG